MEMYYFLRISDPAKHISFLPGGNADPGESVEKTLPREQQEELGWDIKPGAFLGCLENRWSFNRKKDGALVDVFEINFLFIAEATEMTLAMEPISKEAHMKFSWIPLNQLSSIDLLPHPLKTLIPDLASSRPNAVWASTLD